MKMFNDFTLIQRDRMNAILRTILNYKKITRTQLAKLLRLSPSSIVKYTKTLNEMGFLSETGQKESAVGRKSIYIELNPNRGVNISVVFSITSIKGVLLDFSGHILADYILETYQNIPQKEILHSLYDVIDMMITEGTNRNRKIFGIGLAIGGYLDPVRGVSHEFLYAKDWYDVPLCELVETSHNLPCFLVNDANAFAMGDKHYGKGVGINNFISVVMDGGIGLGIVVNGEVYLGESNYSGEFGHNNIRGNSRLCYCGHTGCLETVSSRDFILSECRDGLSKGVYSEISKLHRGSIDDLRIECVIEAANNGDRFARNIFEQVGEYVGYKLSDIVNALNPGLIIFRGSTIDGNAFLFETIQRVVHNQILRHISKTLKMKYSKTDESIAAKGVNSFILMNYFTQETQ
jgi:N-acetylglucosamine repressor